MATALPAITANHKKSFSKRYDQRLKKRLSTMRLLILLKVKI
jgi:hypothetical protein